MFGRKKVEPVTTNTKDWEKEARELKEKLEELKLENRSLKAESESNERILKGELSTNISEAVRKEKEENYKLKEENATLKKEVEILRRAFENMGFDVKDMKAILDKLVDGLVSKNTIQLVK